MIIFDKNQWQLSGDLTIEKIPAIIDLINKQKLDDCFLKSNFCRYVDIKSDF